MFKVRTLNKISPVGLDRLDAAGCEHGDALAGAQALLVRSADVHAVEFEKELLCIARAGAGVNNIPIDRCSDAGIVVFNTPGANANAVKELAICALLLASRDISGGMAWVKTLKGRGDEVPALVEKGKGAFVGPEIEGKKLGVIGLGAIGVMVANAAQKLGMDVYGFDPYISVDAAWGLSHSVHRARDLKSIYETCDYISVHVPLNSETRGMLGAEAFSVMKPGMRIINLARGELVSTPDMLAAFESGAAARYVTDFPNDALLGNDKVVCIPHLGASTPESEDNCAAMAASQLCDYLRTGNIKNSVNFPEAELERAGALRLCVLHKNIPNMVKSITSALAEQNINIENMLNRSKKDYAYTLVDVNDAPCDAALDELRGIAGILRVRVIK